MKCAHRFTIRTVPCWADRAERTRIAKYARCSSQGSRHAPLERHRRQGGDPPGSPLFAQGATGTDRDVIALEIMRILREVATGLPPEQHNPLDDGLPGGWEHQ